MEIKIFLDKELKKRNSIEELKKADPIIVAKEHKDEYISLICALFGYGKATMIVKFLKSLDFSLLDEKDEEIKKYISYKYRFQNSTDISEFFITIKRLKDFSIEDIIYQKYKIENNIIDGIENLILTIKKLNPYSSKGYNFLISNLPKRDKKGNLKPNNSPYKRYNMYIRWLVRKDNIDFGLWTKINKKDLIIPLDTHTFNISRKLNLINRKSYDLKSAILLTEKLKEFDPNDPVKYDFAIYRIGQEKLI